MRRVRSKPWIALSPFFLSGRACRNGRLTTMSGTVPPPYSPHSTWPPARSSPNANRGIATRSSYVSSSRSMVRPILPSIFISFWTTTALTTHPQVKKWFHAHPRYHLHFTPTSASWLNQVERWFAEITRKRIRRGTFHSVPELVKAIQDYIRENNKNPRPF